MCACAMGTAPACQELCLAELPNGSPCVSLQSPGLVRASYQGCRGTVDAGHNVLSVLVRLDAPGAGTSPTT